jgi:hypothetical protein
LATALGGPTLHKGTDLKTDHLLVAIALIDPNSFKRVEHNVHFSKQCLNGCDTNNIDIESILPTMPYLKPKPKN